jgi:hypothetical protein
MKKLYLAVAFALAALAAPAQATLILSANINGTIFTCVDNTACDTNAAVGQLAIADQTIAGVSIQGSSQFQTIGTTNFLNTASFQIINHNLTSATVQLAIGGTDFLGPTQTFAASGSGTWQNANGSNLTITYYGDIANSQPAENPTDFPGTLLATFSDTAVGPADAFSFNGGGAFLTGPLYSMALGTSGTLAAWNGQAGQEATLVGRSQTIITTQAVPEPATIALLGVALLGLGVVRLRRA